MTADRCDLTGLFPAQCACRDHRGDPEPRPSAPVPTGHPFPARFPGKCPACGEGIREGHPIVRIEDDGYIHEGCAA